MPALQVRTPPGAAPSAESQRAQGPALLILELESIARGYVALDAMAKRAPVGVFHAEPMTPGKFWIALHGGEAELDEALRAGLEVAGGRRIDHALLEYAHADVVAA